MATKKARGINRYLKKVNALKDVMIDLKRLEKYHYDYLKFRLRPVGLHSKLRGRVKNVFIENFIAIYHQWHETMKSRNEPFYLKIWFYETKIQESQIVVGIEDKMERYEDIFFVEDENVIHKDLPTHLTWKKCVDEFDFSAEDIAHFSSKTQKKLFKKAHRTIEYNDGTLFFVKQNIVWIGEFSL